MAVVNTSAETILPTLQSAGFVVLGSKAEGGVAYDEYDLTTPVAIVVGNEAHGLSPAVEDVLDRFITIPMVGANESLNVAMAASPTHSRLLKTHRIVNCTGAAADEQRHALEPRRAGNGGSATGCRYRGGVE